MDWLSFFCLGLVVGCGITAVTRSMLNQPQPQPQPRPQPRTVVVVLAALVFAGSFAVLAISHSRAISAYPIGLLVAVLWMTVDTALVNTAQPKKPLANALGWFHLFVGVTLSVGAAWYVIPPTIRAIELDSAKLDAELIAEKAKNQATPSSVTAPASTAK